MKLPQPHHACLTALLMAMLLCAAPHVQAGDLEGDLVRQCQAGNQGLSFCQQQARRVMSASAGHSMATTQRIANSFGSAMSSSFSAMDAVSAGSPGKSLQDYMKKMIIDALTFHESFADVPGSSRYGQEAVDEYIEKCAELMDHPAVRKWSLMGSLGEALFGKDDVKLNVDAYAANYERGLMWKGQFMAGYREKDIYPYKPAKALDLFKEVVEIGRARSAARPDAIAVWPQAQFLVALSHMNGVGTDKDPAAAAREFHVLADTYDAFTRHAPPFSTSSSQNETDNEEALGNALLALVNMHMTGLGVDRDPVKADGYARQAARVFAASKARPNSELYDPFMELIAAYR